MDDKPAAGVEALTVMMDSDELSAAELRLFKAVGRIFVRDPAAYAAQLQAGRTRPAPGETP
ncbi:MAG: hypothetical protein H0V64_10930 [Geodermatophilaceae bacterium]|nr:hypothetical protein [Geodermatophilaceae bacterium]